MSRIDFIVLTNSTFDGKFLINKITSVIYIYIVRTRTDGERKPWLLSRNFSFVLIIVCVRVCVCVIYTNDNVQRPVANGAELEPNLFQCVTVK